MKILSMPHSLRFLRAGARNLALLTALVGALAWQPAQALRIKEVAAVQGVRSNQLSGYGLVVGLDGTGDQTTQMPYTTQSVQNYLQQMGITLPGNINARNIQLKNVAAVIVTAELPAFAQPGQQIDVVVSSMGNAKSLRGGTVAGEHSVILAGEEERLTLSHSAENRAIFARGALKAAEWLIGREPGRYAMDHVLGL